LVERRFFDGEVFVAREACGLLKGALLHPAHTTQTSERGKQRQQRAKRATASTGSSQQPVALIVIAAWLGSATSPQITSTVRCTRITNFQ
jgi:hypothetical protein